MTGIIPENSLRLAQVDLVGLFFELVICWSFFGGFKMVCWWFVNSETLKPFWSFVFAVFLTLKCWQLMDLWKNALMDALISIHRHPALGKAKTFRSRKQSGRPRLWIPWDLKPGLFTSNLSDLNLSIMILYIYFIWSHKIAIIECLFKSWFRFMMCIIVSDWMIFSVG